MPKSFELVHFALRPAKNIERKMILEALGRLAHIRPLGEYRYVGFPSIYYADFILFHKALGLTPMIGIEREIDDQERFEFNRPFDCIDLMFGDSNEILPEVNWESPAIVWLDYTDRLIPEILTDIEFVVGAAPSGSMLIVTVNANPGDFSPDRPRLQVLKEQLGEEKVPVDLDEADLPKWGTAQTFRRIIDAEIDASITARNGLLAGDEQLQYGQLFNFHYKDSAMMVTVGGMIYDLASEAQVTACRFDALEFFRSGESPYHIVAPNLTYREMQHLDRQLPIGDPSALEAMGLKDVDLQAYAGMYRWYPTFSEVDL